MTAKVMRNYKLPVEQVHSEKRRDQTPTFPKLRTSVKKTPEINTNKAWLIAPGEESRCGFYKEN